MPTIHISGIPAHVPDAVIAPLERDLAREIAAIAAMAIDESIVTVYVLACRGSKVGKVVAVSALLFDLPARTDAVRTEVADLIANRVRAFSEQYFPTTFQEVKVSLDLRRRGDGYAKLGALSPEAAGGS